ncbi:MAG: hypothetical protein WCP35_14500, partial [Verrucomicrobiota bacterium]
MSATALRRARVLIFDRSIAAAALALALAAPAARASTTISSGTFIINDANCTKVGTTTTWNDTGTCTISAGATLTTQPGQNNTVANNDALAFAGGSGTITFNFNDNDTDFMLNGAVSSAATGAQTLAIYTGYSGNGDRESVTFNSAIPNATGGSTLGLNVNFRTQTGSTRGAGQIYSRSEDFLVLRI